MTEVLLIRHALPVRDEPDDGSAADPGLSDVGREQAQRLAEWLAPEGIDELWSSSMRRAIETARPLAELTGLELRIDEGLCEYDRTHAAYVPVEEGLATNDPRTMALVRGELPFDPEEFGPVAATAVDRIVEQATGERTAIVTHGGVINAWASRVLHLDRWLFFAPAYTGISRFGPSVYSGTMSLVTLNELAHLRVVAQPGQ